jgi:bacterioferritin-associated ferredoxin
MSESANIPDLGFFAWVAVMDFGHWHSSTDGQATAIADRPLCRCLNVTENDIREAISEHEPQTVKAVSQICGAGAGCMSCHRHIRRMLSERALCHS